MAPAFAAVGIWGLTYLERRSEELAGIAAFLDGEKTDLIVPGTVIAKADVPIAYNDGCHQRFEKTEVIQCTYGKSDGKFVVALVGGSHSLQWLPALQRLAREVQQMRIIVMTKSVCPLTLSGADLALPDEAECLEWNRHLIKRVAKLEPDVIVSLLTTTRETGNGGDLIPEGFRAAWAALPKVPILAIRDTPRSDFDVVDCVDRMGLDSPACVFIRAAQTSEGLASSGDLPENLYPLDLTEEICFGDTCPAVRNGVLVWRDRSHLTATYAQVLAPRFRQAFENMGLLAVQGSN